MKALDVNNISLRKIILYLLVLFLLTNIASIIIIKVSKVDYSTEIDVSGRNRMLSQRMILFANIYNQEQDSLILQSCEKTMFLQRESIKAIRNGGIAPGFDVPLKPCPISIISKMDKAETVWEEYQTYVNTVINEGSTTEMKEEALRKLKAESGRILSIYNDLVIAYVKEDKKSSIQQNWLLSASAVFSCVVFLICYLFLHKKVFSQLQMIAKFSKEVSYGKKTKKLDIEGTNEIGLISSSLNSLLGKMRKTSDFIAEMGRENFEYNDQDFFKNKVFKKDPLINSLLKTQELLRFNQQRKMENLREVELRQWANEGRSNFNLIFQKADADIKKTASVILSELIRFLEINQGTMFIRVDENSNDLERVAYYAYDRNKHIDNSIIKINEGQVGSVFREGRHIYLSEVPEDYLKISSGLGDFQPSAVLIVPIMTNEVRVGVLEIASFNKFEEYKIKFVIELCKEVATVFSKIILTSKTKKLLEVSKNQADNLRSSEEEMKQNMEEMQAIQEEFLRKEKNYIDEIKRLKKQM